MTRWLGVVVSGSGVVAVDAEVPASGPLVILGDSSWPLNSGGGPKAYDHMYQRVVNYVGENHIARVIVKESALTGRGITKAHLTSAELRGVVIAAASSVTETEVLAKAAISKQFGERKVDEYLADVEFWKDEITGETLRTGSREAAMLLIAARKIR